MKSYLAELINQALLDLRRKGKLKPESQWADIQIERTRNPEHGDYASNVALVLSKAAGTTPRALAEEISAHLLTSKHVAKVEIAGPGFLNFYLSHASVRGVVRQVLNHGDQFGHAPPGSLGRITVEFVSANPTGPLHVGHGRGAAYGASLSSLFEASGYAVQREYYVNDNGRQMDILATSVWLRYLDLAGDRVRFPDNGYRGDYVYDIARAVRQAHGDRLRRAAFEIERDLPPDEAQGGDKELHIDALVQRTRSLLGEADYAVVFEAGLTAILDDIRDDLKGFQVSFDRWFSERSLATSGALDRALARLRDAGMLYVEGGATWFKAKAFGDEKDRVVVRENGQSTYFASDIAYLLDKVERGFEKLIYVFGADHHGYIARLKACAQGLGLDPEIIEVKLIQFAVLYRGSEKVQMSTRSGEFVTLRELRDEVGSDACRYFYVMRSQDQHLDFDLELAKRQSNDNPVYYVQYAHARISSVFRQLNEKLIAHNRSLGDSALERLAEAEEVELMKTLGRYPEIIEMASANRAPHQLAQYLAELARDFHSCYDRHKLLIADEALRNARLNLALATQIVLRGGLKHLGVSAPDHM